jgi:phosphoglycolate phosphatase
MKNRTYKHKAVIFDMDGTILHTVEDLADSMNTVLKNAGLPVHEVDAYKYFMGSGLRNLVTKALPEDMRTEEHINRFKEAMREEYAKTYDNKTRPFEGIPELFAQLKSMGIKIAILSNKTDNTAKLAAKKYFPVIDFDAVLGERPGIPKKPDPKGAIEIAELLGLDPSLFLYVGDTGIDMKTANAAGMYAIGALWGYRKPDELLENGAHALIEKPEQLIDYL